MSPANVSEVNVDPLEKRTGGLEFDANEPKRARLDFEPNTASPEQSKVKIL